MVEGANDINVTSGEYSAIVTSIVGSATFSQLTGTAHITWDATKKVIFGTFVLTSPEDDGARTVTLTGSLNLPY